MNPRDTRGRDRPEATEIEITPEMINAGVTALEELRDSCSMDYLVAQVYIAMSVRRVERPHPEASVHSSDGED